MCVKCKALPPRLSFWADPPHAPRCSASICGLKVILWRWSQGHGSTAGTVEGSSGQHGRASSDLDFTTILGSSMLTAKSGVRRDGGCTGEGAVDHCCLRWGVCGGPGSNQRWEKKGRAKQNMLPTQPRACLVVCYSVSTSMGKQTNCRFGPSGKLGSLTLHTGRQGSLLWAALPKIPPLWAPPATLHACTAQGT